MRTLVGGVGYRHLRDHSFGIAFADALAADASADVAVEDISYNPIAVVQRLQDDPPAARAGLAIVGGALARDGREPGTLAIYRWDCALPAPARIHESIAEAVTGIIALDNTLIIARHFEALPPRVVIVEFEPAAHEAGDTLTPAAAAALDRAVAAVRDLIADPRRVEQLPLGALPGGRARHNGVVFEQVNYER